MRIALFYYGPLIFSKKLQVLDEIYGVWKTEDIIRKFIEALIKHGEATETGKYRLDSGIRTCLPILNQKFLANISDEKIYANKLPGADNVLISVDYELEQPRFIRDI